MEAFDQIRAGVLNDRSQFFKDLSAPFYGANRPGSTVSQGLRDSFWLQGMLCGLKAAYDCIKAFSETDFTEDLKKIDVPTLILHGDGDQIVPIDDSARLSAKLVKGSTLKVIPGAPHGMCSTLKDQINTELLNFFQQSKRAAAYIAVWPSRVPQGRTLLKLRSASTLGDDRERIDVVTLSIGRVPFLLCYYE